MFRRKYVKEYHTDIRSVTDKKYTWQELNCFYRPFAYAMQGSGYRQEGIYAFLLLTSLYMTHSRADNSKMLYNRLHPALQYFMNELQSVFDASIDVEYYSGEKDMHRKIERSLENGCEVVIPFDLYLLPYSLNYLEQHHRHYTLIKGCDGDKGIYYILDNMHNSMGDSTEYTDFMISYHQMYLGMEAFHRRYNDMCEENSYFWKIKCSGIIKQVRIKMGNYLKRILTGFVDGSIPIHYVEKDMQYNYNGHGMLDMVEQINMRNVYYGEMMSFIESFNHVDSKQVEILRNQTLIMKKNWNVIKILLLKRSYTKEYDDKIAENIKLEEEWHICILEIIKNGIDEGERSCDEEIYTIYNPLHAGIKRIELQDTLLRWNIFLSGQTVYDTWTLQDDACQILFPIDDNINGMEVNIYNKDVEEGSSFHIGIKSFGCD